MKRMKSKVVWGRIFFLLAGGILCGMLSACMKVGPDFESPVVDDMPQSWLQGAKNSTMPGMTETFAGEAGLDTWWEQFNDPLLSKLIAEGRAKSPSVELALLRVVQARAQYALAVGALFPQQQEIQAGYGWEHPSNRAADAPQKGVSAQSQDVQTLSTGLQVTWELDFWGKFRRGTEAYRALLLSSRAAHDLALVTLSADIASAYLSLRTVQEQKRIAEENSVAQAEAVRLTEARFRLGASSERDYQQALALQKSTQADIPQLQQQIVAYRNTLCVLLGRPPQQMADLEKARPVPMLRNRLAVGIPADILRRRPDVRQAEWAAAAQCAQIGIAKADLFPSLSLSGFIGFSGSNVGAFALGDTFSQGFTSHSGASLVIPFFNYGRLLNAVRIQDTLFQQSLVQYRQTVLAALQESENALEGFVRQQERVALLRESSNAAGRSVKLVLDQYQAGETDFTSVISSQSSLYTQQNALATAQGNAVQQAVALFRALGGGWKNAPLTLPPQTIAVMKERTYWGAVLDAPESSPHAQGTDPLSAPVQ